MHAIFWLKIPSGAKKHVFWQFKAEKWLFWPKKIFLEKKCKTLPESLILSRSTIDFTVEPSPASSLINHPPSCRTKQCQGNCQWCLQSRPKPGHREWNFFRLNIYFISKSYQKYSLNKEFKIYLQVSHGFLWEFRQMSILSIA